MTMWRHLLVHEWKVLRADGALLGAVLLLAAALAWGTYSGSAAQRVVTASVTAATEDEAERYGALQRRVSAYEKAIAQGAEQRPPDPRLASSVSGRAGARVAVLPPLPTAVLSVGQSDLLPSALRVSTEPREQMLAASEIENPHRLLDGRFDVSFVFVTLYPLLILALAYNMLAGEREQGTLALVLAQPVALARVVHAKILVRFGAVLGVSVALVSGGLVAAGVVPWASDVWWRVAAWVAMIVAYGAFWFAVAVAIGSRGWSSATTALATAAVWLVLVVVVPAVTNLAVNAWYPVPSRMELVQATRDASDAATARGSALLAQYFEDHPEMAPVVAPGETQTPNFAATRIAVAAEVARVTAPIIEHHQAQLRAQQQAVVWLRWLSPALLAREVFDDLAGTGQHRHRHFVAQVDAFHQAWQAFFTPRILQRASLLSLDEVPSFQYQEETPGAVLRRTGLLAAGLLLVTLALSVVSLRMLRHYPLTS